MPFSFSTSLTDNWAPDRVVVFSPSNYANIQAAVDAAELLAASEETGITGAGVAVVIPTGFWDETVIIRKFVSLIGQGAHCTFIDTVEYRPISDSAGADAAQIHNIKMNNLVVSNETAAASGTFYLPFLQSGMFLTGCYVVTSASFNNLATVWIKQTQIDGAFTINNSGYFDFVHSYFNTLEVTGDDSTTSSWGGGRTAVYLDSTLCFDTLDATRTGGTEGPHIGLYNSYVNTLTMNDGTNLFATGGTVRSRTLNGSVTIDDWYSRAPFKPTTSGDWSTDPTNVDVALDELAARSAANIGDGEGNVFKQKDSNKNLELRTIKAGSNITVTQNANDITIAGPAGSGEANTASNVGSAGVGVFKQKTLVDLEFKKLNAGTGISINDDTPNSKIDISSTITQYTDDDARSAVVIDSIADSDTTHAPSRNAVFDALATKAATSHGHVAADISDFTAAAKAATVADAINNGTTDVAPSQNAVFDALALKADLASPALTGTPTAPTAAPGTNTTQVATTAFVAAALGMKAAVAATWQTLRTFTNIGTSYVNVLNLQLNGGRQHVCFDNYTEFMIIGHYNHVGAGTINLRVVDQTNNSNVLGECAGTTGAAEKEVELAWTALPSWATGDKYLVPQMKSTTAGDDPVFRDCIVCLR